MSSRLTKLPYHILTLPNEKGVSAITKVSENNWLKRILWAIGAPRKWIRAV